MRFREHRFLVPVVRDSDKRAHAESEYDALKATMLDWFGGYTCAPNVYGCWKDSEGPPTPDESSVFIVGFDRDDSELASRFDRLIAWVKRAFDQQCIYCTYTDAALL